MLDHARLSVKPQVRARAVRVGSRILVRAFVDELEQRAIVGSLDNQRLDATRIPVLVTGNGSLARRTCGGVVVTSSRCWLMWGWPRPGRTPDIYLFDESGYTDPD